MNIFDHVGFNVGSIDNSIRFYTAALAPLGIKSLADYDFAGVRVVGFGDEQPQFWINSGKAIEGRVHVAFVATSHAAVAGFYDAAIASGGIDNGKPGPRKEYHEHYYAAYVLDPDGHNIEAVCHMPDPADQARLTASA